MRIYRALRSFGKNYEKFALRVIDNLAQIRRMYRQVENDTTLHFIFLLACSLPPIAMLHGGNRGGCQLAKLPCKFAWPAWVDGMRSGSRASVPTGAPVDTATNAWGAATAGIDCRRWTIAARRASPMPSSVLLSATQILISSCLVV